MPFKTLLLVGVAKLFLRRALVLLSFSQSITGWYHMSTTALNLQATSRPIPHVLCAAYHTMVKVDGKLLSGEESKTASPNWMLTAKGTVPSCCSRLVCFWNQASPSSWQHCLPDHIPYRTHTAAGPCCSPRNKFGVWPASNAKYMCHRPAAQVT